MSGDLPEPDRIASAPHPRETSTVFGHEHAKQEFLAALASGKLHSGWLLTGPQGIGKASLCYKFAALLLARESELRPGSIDLDRSSPTIRQMLARSHPRLCVITRGPNSTGSNLSDVITVDQVRKLKEFFHMSSADGGRRVVIIDAADEMNRSAANALLKELEEPPEGAILLLVSHQPSGLLPTIRSRCRTLRLQPLAPVEVAKALDQIDLGTTGAADLGILSAGSVGDAVRLAEDDGVALYDRLIGVVATAPNMDRQAANALADQMVGKAADSRYRLMLDLIDKLLVRLARAGIFGPPDPAMSEKERILMARLSPNAATAQAWAGLASRLQETLRHGKAVNIDASALVLDALLQIDALAMRQA